MKKIIATEISLMFALGLLRAQQEITRMDSTGTRYSTTQFGGIIAIREMDQRKIYRWDNGQSSTAAGRQAGDASANYARVFGDSAVVIKEWNEKIKVEAGRTAKH
jgi:hypothetical protein